MSSNGFIKLHRKIQDTSFYKDHLAVHLAIHLLINASHKLYKQTVGNKEEVLVERGSLIVGRYSLAHALGAKPTTIYNKLKLLELVRFCDIKTNNKYSIVSICNYEAYQSQTASSEQQFGQQNDSRVTAERQQNDTNKKDKKDKNNTYTSDDGYFRDIVWPFWEYFKVKTNQPNIQLLPHRKDLILKRLGDFGLEELKKAVDNFAKDDWPERHKFMELKYCIGVVRGVDNLEKWLGYTPKNNEFYLDKR